MVQYSVCWNCSNNFSASIGKYKTGKLGGYISVLQLLLLYKAVFRSTEKPFLWKVWSFEVFFKRMYLLHHKSIARTTESKVRNPYNLPIAVMNHKHKR